MEQKQKYKKQQGNSEVSQTDSLVTSNQSWKELEN